MNDTAKTTTRWYEVHWAASNRCDELGAMRVGAARHETRESAEAEARAICPPGEGRTTTIVVEVRS